MKYKIPTVVIIVLSVSSWFLLTYLGQNTKSEDYETYAIESESRQKEILSALIRRYHEPAVPGVKAIYEKLIRDQPELIASNTTNRGAELMQMIFNSPIRPPIDTDRDGRAEAYDEWGNPLILLGKGLEEDEIIDAKGFRRKVVLPPYYGKGFYINALRFHTWLDVDAKVLDAECELMPQSSTVPAAD